jgi:hypothetical protein
MCRGKNNSPDGTVNYFACRVGSFQRCCVHTVCEFLPTLCKKGCLCNPLFGTSWEAVFTTFLTGSRAITEIFSSDHPHPTPPRRPRNDQPSDPPLGFVCPLPQHEVESQAVVEDDSVDWRRSCVDRTTEEERWVDYGFDTSGAMCWRRNQWEPPSLGHNNDEKAAIRSQRQRASCWTWFASAESLQCFRQQQSL